MTRRAGLHGFDPSRCAVQEMQVHYCAADSTPFESFSCQGAFVVMCAASWSPYHSTSPDQGVLDSWLKSDEAKHKRVTV